MKKLFLQTIGIAFTAMFALPLSVWAVEPITVIIDTGARITLTDEDGDSYYDIATADELYAFAAAVNGGNKSSIYGELTSNIIVNNNVLDTDGSLNGIPSRSWIPIGSGTYKFNGCFDGNNHTISGIYCNAPDSTYVGLFGRVGGGLYRNGIRNVGVIDSYFHGGGYFYRTSIIQWKEGYTGSIAAYYVGTYNVSGGTSYSGVIENCYSKSCVNGGTYVGGIVGYNKANVSVENCYNIGTVEGIYAVGGISGSHGYHAVLTDCYNIGSVKGDSCYVGGIVGYDDNRHRTYTRCYYLAGCAIDGNGTIQSGRGSSALSESWADVDGVVGKTDFVSGEVAYLLQGTQEEPVWGQNIDNGSPNQMHPVLGGATVYGGYRSCATNAQQIYTNDATISAEKPTHVEKTAATCTSGAVCEHCGEIYTEPNASNHKGNTNNQYTRDEGGLTHSLICSECHIAIHTDTHSGGTITCTHGAVCEYCSYIYTEPSHQYGEEGFCTQCGMMNPDATALIVIDGKHTDFTVAKDMELNTLRYTRTLPNLVWNALYLPVEIPVEILSMDYDVAYVNDVHSYDRDNNGTIDAMEMEVIKIIEGTLHASHPYLIRAKNEGARSMNLVLENINLSSTATAEQTSIVCSSAYTKFEVKGIYTKHIAEELAGCYAISTTGAWQQVAEDSWLNPFRLYLQITALDGSPVKVEEDAMQAIGIRTRDETTGLECSELKTPDAELIHDLQGRCVTNPTKGLYIVNGKKMILE